MATGKEIQSFIIDKTTKEIKIIKNYNNYQDAKADKHYPALVKKAIENNILYHDMYWRFKEEIQKDINIIKIDNIVKKRRIPIQIETNAKEYNMLLMQSVLRKYQLNK